MLFPIPSMICSPINGFHVRPLEFGWDWRRHAGLLFLRDNQGIKGLSDMLLPLPESGLAWDRCV